MSQKKSSQILKPSPLEKRVLRWCRSVHPLGIGRAERVAELHDHLMCEIEMRVAEGVAPEQALNEAITELGAAQELVAEFAKLEGWCKWSVVLGALATGNSRALDRQLSGSEHIAVLTMATFFFLLAIPAALKWIPGTSLSLTVSLSLLPLHWMAIKALAFSEAAQVLVRSKKI